MENGKKSHDYKGNNMIIEIGDTIQDERGRTGKIVNIGIATDKNDIGAELETSLNAKRYDTELDYTGAITFCNEEKQDTYWCYFIQMKKVIKEKGSQ